MNNWQIVAST